MRYKATDLTPDRQRMQTMAMVAFVMNAIGKHIPDDGSSHKRATYDLFDALQNAGVDVITAEHRKAAGLPPRGPMGWTDQELHIMEQKRIEAMLSPMPIMVFQK